MSENKKIICFEGINNRVWEMPILFNEEMCSMMELYSEAATEIVGFNCYKQILEGKSDDEMKNAYTELVGTYICDYVIFQTYLKYGIQPEFLMGFSLGLNTALVCAGNITFEDGLFILVVNRHCMEYLYKNGNYGMAVIVGLELATVERVIQKHNLSERLKIASEASEYSVLITGEKDAIGVIESDILAEGAMRINRINSYIPFHFGLHNEFIDEEVSKINQIKVNAGKYKVYSVYSLDFLSDEDEMTEELKKNIYSPMKWREAFKQLEEKGYRDFWDISLTASNKKMTSLKNNDSLFYSFKQFKADYLKIKE